jgi:FkbM family methyltransferase
MLVSRLLSKLGIFNFSEILAGYSHQFPGFKVCIDGGAGTGETAVEIMDSISNAGMCLCFEPNVKNVKNFCLATPNVTLVEKALSSENGFADFYISQEVSNPEKNQFHVEGSSFVGKIVTRDEAEFSGEGRTYQVEKVRLDTELLTRKIKSVDFIKLDLQGHEMEALRGLGGYLSSTKMIWFEYVGQHGLCEWLEAEGYFLMDTKYLFVGEPIPLIEDLFAIVDVGVNSIGKKIFFGVRKHHWKDYYKCFSFMQRKRRMIQTDILAVNKKYLAEVLDVLTVPGQYEESESLGIPDILNSIS